MTDNMKRLEYADYAKAMAIFLVVLGHTHPGYLPGKDWLYLDVCYAFHMPLFFIVSGFFTKAREQYSVDGWRAFLWRNFCALMVPYFIWGVVYMPFSYAHIAQLAYGSWMQLRYIGTLTSLWFLPTLFVARVACEAVHALAWKFNVSDRILSMLSVPLFFALGFLLPHHNTIGVDWGNVWQYDIGLMAAGYMMLGALARPFFDRLAKARIGWIALSIVVAAGLFTAGFIEVRPSLKVGSDIMMQMCNADYGPWAWCLANALAGSVTILAFAILMTRILPDNRFLLFVGANTIGVFLIHKPILWDLVKLSERLGLPADDLVSALPATCLAFLFALPIVAFLLKVAPRVFGKKA